MVDPRLPNNKPGKCLKLRFLIFSRRFCRETVAPPRQQPLRKDAQRDCNSRASLCPRQRLFYLSSVPAEKVNVETRKWTQLGFGFFFRPLLFPLGSNPKKQSVFSSVGKILGTKSFLRNITGKKPKDRKKKPHACIIRETSYILKICKNLQKIDFKILTLEKIVASHFLPHPA